MGISCLQARQKTFPWAGSEGSSVPHAGQKFTSVSKAAREGILMPRVPCSQSNPSCFSLTASLKRSSNSDSSEIRSVMAFINASWFWKTKWFKISYTHGWYTRDVRKMETSPVPKFWPMLDSFYPFQHPLYIQTFQSLSLTQNGYKRQISEAP